MASRIRSELARRAPGLEDRIAVASWRRWNRDRAHVNGAAPPALAGLVERLHRDGVVITDAETVFDEGTGYEANQYVAVFDRLRA